QGWLDLSPEQTEQLRGDVIRYATRGMTGAPPMSGSERAAQIDGASRAKVAETNIQGRIGLEHLKSGNQKERMQLEQQFNANLQQSKADLERELASIRAGATSESEIFRQSLNVLKSREDSILQALGDAEATV